MWLKGATGRGVTYKLVKFLAWTARSSSLDLMAANSMTEEGTLANRATFNLWKE